MHFRLIVCVAAGGLLTMGCEQSQPPAGSNPRDNIVGEWVLLDSPSETEAGVLGSRLTFRDDGVLVATLVGYDDAAGLKKKSELSETFPYRIEGNLLYAQPFGGEAPVKIDFEGDTLVIELTSGTKVTRFLYARDAQEHHNKTNRNDGDSKLPEELVKKLGDEDQAAAQNAFEQLIGLGEVAVPALLSVLENDENSNARGYACLALGSIAPSGDKVIAALASVATSDVDWTVRMNAIDALRDIRRPAPLVVPQLVEATKDENRHVRSAAIRAFAALAPGDKRFPMVLKELLCDKDPGVQGIAAILIIQSEAVRKRVDDSIINSLSRMLSSKDFLVRAAAVDALSSLGSRAENAQLRLSQQLRVDENSQVRYAILQALVDISKNPETIVPPLILATADQEADIREFALKLLDELGSESQPVIEALVKRLNDKEPDIRIQAVRSLGAIGHGAEAAVPALKKSLDDPDEGVRRAAKEAIKQIESR